MVDIVNRETRSKMMSAIRGKDTKPEKHVRSLLHRHGYRFRVHDSRLPGKPDIVLPKHNAVLLINGCFWHGHDCHLFKWPSTNVNFWRNKIEKTKARDRKNSLEYAYRGWRVLTVWQCAIEGKRSLETAELLDKLETFLRSEVEQQDISGL